MSPLAGYSDYNVTQARSLAGLLCPAHLLPTRNPLTNHDDFFAGTDSHLYNAATKSIGAAIDSVIENVKA